MLALKTFLQHSFAVLINISITEQTMLWQNDNWSFSCDFRNNDLSNMQSRGEDCGRICGETTDCTHFTWTNYNGGTCWMKKGPVSRNDAYNTYDNSMVCGIVRNWAFACDFVSNDLSNFLSRSEQCGSICENTKGCTHFTWTSYNGGTCWLKQGLVLNNNAILTNDRSMICGINNNNGGIIDTRVMDNVLATRHGANEIGACMLPMGDYSIRYPVALGNIEALGHLKFRPDLCGHVLSVDCGNGVIEIIITNSNLGGGLDLYGSTWDRATGRKPPGITNCKVQLTNKNAFNFNGPRCYHATGEVNNPYYRNVGLLNTGGKIVSSALLNGIHGSHRGNNPYYAFDGLANPDQLVTFYFEDGSSYSVALRDCLNGNNKQFWS